MDTSNGFPLRSSNYDRLSATLLALLHDEFMWPMPQDIFDLERNDQRIAVAVCDATGMSPERWDTLDVFSREPWLEKTIATLSKERPSQDGVPDETHDSKAPSRKSTKQETTQKVNAAIAYKMQNPEWTESRCAKEAGLAPSTLNGRAEWTEWRQKIEAAHSQGRMRKVKQEFDRRIGESVVIDPDTECDQDTGRSFT